VLFSPFFFFSFFSLKKQSQVNLRSTRYRTKSFFRIAYSGRPQNGRSESKHIDDLRVARMRKSESMPSARSTMSAERAATGSGASSFV